MFSGQSLGGRETGHKKNGKHVTKLADSLLGWRLDLDESSPCSSKRQAETTTGAAGYKFDDSTTGKIKVNNNGTVDALLKHKLSEVVTTSVVTSVNVKDFTSGKTKSPLPVGISFDLKL